MKDLDSLSVFKANDMDIIASPLDYYETKEWYSKEIGEDIEDIIMFQRLNIDEEGIWAEVLEDDENYEAFEYLRYIDDFKELIRGNRKDLFGNVKIIDGEMCKFITIKQFLQDYMSESDLAKPQIIGSTEY